jgi:hypothetical protein
MAKNRSKFNSEYVTLAKVQVVNQMIKFDSEDNEDMSLNIGKKIDYFFEKKMARVRLIFDIFKGDNPSENTLTSFHIDFHFHVSNMEECIDKKDENINIDAVMVSHLIAIAYSTSRGIIIERLYNTPYKHTILPIIDPYKLLKEEEQKVK